MILCSFKAKNRSTNPTFFLSKTQFGLRKNKSCAQAMFIAKRLIDIAEQTSNPMVMALLDWKQAFDKVDHEKLIEALKRNGIGDHSIKIIESLYLNPTFRSKHKVQTSKLKQQLAGIRQGCTLSLTFSSFL